LVRDVADLARNLNQLFLIRREVCKIHPPRQGYTE
jgi:hypothetical protein